MKKLKKIFVCIILTCVFILLCLNINDKNNYIKASNTNGNYSPISAIQQKTNELFGNISIKSSEVLYNLDESPDYIYVEFSDSGYAVYSSQTLDVLECSLTGSLPYST